MIKTVWLSYFKALFKALILILIVSIVSWLINIYHPLSQQFINFIGLLGLGCGATAIYGFLGWEIQSYCGNTSPEKLNQTLARILLSLGLICVAFTYLLKPL